MKYWLNVLNKFQLQYLKYVIYFIYIQDGNIVSLILLKSGLTKCINSLHNLQKTVPHQYFLAWLLESWQAQELISPLIMSEQFLTLTKSGSYADKMLSGIWTLWLFLMHSHSFTHVFSLYYFRDEISATINYNWNAIVIQCSYYTQNNVQR